MLFGVYAGIFFSKPELFNLCLFSWMLLVQASPGHRSFGFNQWAPRILDRDLPIFTDFEV